MAVYHECYTPFIFMSATSVMRFWRSVGFRWVGARCWERGAAMAFFALFSIAPLFVLLLSLLDRLFGEGVARNEVYVTLVRGLGVETADAIRALLLQPNLFQGDWITIAGNMVLTAVGAAALFRHMQTCLQVLWGRTEERSHPVPRFFRGFIRSFATMGALVIAAVGGFFLLASALLLGPVIKEAIFGQSIPTLWAIFSNWFVFAGALGVFSVLYFTLAPEAPSFRRLWTSLAVLLAGLLAAKALIAPLTHSKSLFSLFGAGSAVVYLLLWCFLLSQLFLFGAVVGAVRTEQEG